MKRFHSLLIGAGCLTVLCGAADAQVRTWGFSKDAVYEWSAQGDSVSISNQAVDTLRFDTVMMEILKPSANGYVVRFSKINPNVTYGMSAGGTSAPGGVNPKTIIVNPSQSLRFSEFYVDVNAPPLVKKSEAAAVGDTMQARLIFQASAGRGRDTLLVSGIQQTTSLRFLHPAGAQPMASHRFFDLRGRRMEPASGRARVAPAPLVSPKE